MVIDRTLRPISALTLPDGAELFIPCEVPVVAFEDIKDMKYVLRYANGGRTIFECSQHDEKKVNMLRAFWVGHARSS